MSQPYDRVFNFSAGPCTLPVSVLEQARDDLLNYQGKGMSVMEMSHRSKAFESIIQTAEADLRELMAIPDNYQVLFLQGGASLQFSMIPMCFLPSGQAADYIVTGTWGKKAVEAAQLVGQTTVVFDGKATNYDHAPRPSQLSYSEKPAYVHFTSNETIQGVDFNKDPLNVPAPVVCDMSSNILSRPVEVTKYSVIYAGAQKNMGPAGLTVVILRDDMIEKVPKKMHPMLDYRLQAENDSLYNTPPCWSIYMCGLVFQWLKNLGGLEAMEAINEKKAGLLYDTIDAHEGFYRGHAAKGSRSKMNVTWTLPTEELTEMFLKGAKAEGMEELKGHRSVGGLRASIYNAFPVEGCEALAAYMKAFVAKHG